MSEQIERTEYRVMDAAANMPSSCRGRYRRVAVVEVDPAALAQAGRTEPAMISERAKGVRRVVRTWERLNVGDTERCAYRRALSEAEALAHSLNTEESRA